MKRKGRRTGLFAILLSLAMLFSSVPVFAAEKPDMPSGAPTWGDFFNLFDYVNSETDGAEWHNKDDWEHALHNWCPAGKKIVDEELGEEFYKMAGQWFWDKIPEDVNDGTLPLAGETLEHYDDLYELAMKFVGSMDIATGECYLEYDHEKGETVDPLYLAFVAAETLANSVWDRPNSADSPLQILPDDTEPSEVEGMWVRESDWNTFVAAMDAIRENEYPYGEGEEESPSGWNWDNITRMQLQKLTDLFTEAFNTLNAAVMGGDLTPATPETSGSTTQTPTSNSVVTATGTTTIAAAVEAIATTSSVKGVKSTVSGAYFIKKVNGVAIITPMADIIAGYGIGSGERLYAKVWDLDPKKSYMAKQVIDVAAASVGAEVGPGLNIELGKLSGGKYSLLSQDGSAITIKVGIPASFVQNGKTYAVVRVRPGGAVSILADQDTDIDTVTFTTTGGAGADAIIRY